MTPSKMSLTRKQSIQIKQFFSNQHAIINCRRPDPNSISYADPEMGQLSFRLSMNRYKHLRLGMLSDIMSSIAIISIILMIIANELTFNNVGDENTVASWFLKLIITFITVVLICCVLYYHFLDLSLDVVSNFYNSIRIKLTTSKILMILLEVIICAIHPIPRRYPSEPPQTLTGEDTEPFKLKYTPVDIGLSLPMFFRLYLVSRSVMFHSQLVRNTSIRCLGSMNQITIDLPFLIKTSLERWPTRFLLIFCTILFFIGSWSLRACNYRPTKEHFTFADSMWLFLITFATVGYGDLYPSTYCGRTIAALTGVVGILTSALLIAVLSQKLLLSREEKYVHTFVMKMELAKRRQHYAANIVIFTVRFWFLRRRNAEKKYLATNIQKKIFQSINRLRQIKARERLLEDSCVSLNDLNTIQRLLNRQREETETQITETRDEIKILGKQITHMTNQLTILQNQFNLLLHDVTDVKTNYL